MSADVVLLPPGIWNSHLTLPDFELMDPEFLQILNPLHRVFSMEPTNLPFIVSLLELLETNKNVILGPTFYHFSQNTC